MRGSFYFSLSNGLISDNSSGDNNGDNNGVDNGDMLDVTARPFSTPLVTCVDSSTPVLHQSAKCSQFLVTKLYSFSPILVLALRTVSSGEYISYLLMLAKGSLSPEYWFAP